MTRYKFIILEFTQTVLTKEFTVNYKKEEKYRCDKHAIKIAELFYESAPDYSGKITEASKKFFDFLLMTDFILSEKPKEEDYDATIDNAFKQFDSIFQKTYNDLKLR